MRAIFMGTAELACASLRALQALPGVDVVAVVTQPDRPKGRTLALSPSAVKVTALELGMPVLTPERVNAPESLAALRELCPDVIVVVAYGQILRDALLQVPPHGCVNVHASLLPKYRGAAPIQRAIMDGAAQTGVTVMRMNARMDAGDMLATASVAIEPDESAGHLHGRLAVVGAELLARTLPDWVAGRIVPRPQEEAAATLAPKLTKAEGQIDWTADACAIYNRIRGCDPWPGAACLWPDRAPGAPFVLKVRRAAVEPGASAPPGTVLRVDGGGPLVAAGRGALRLLEVQAPGGKWLAGDAFLRGRPVAAGARLAVSGQ